MKLRLLSAFLIAAALALPGTALAQMGPGRMGTGPAAADANHDGTVTAEEMQTMHGQQFGRLDRNADGVLTTDEMGPGQGAMRLDADQDGKVTRDEFTAALPPMLDRHDRNGDGKITPDEMRPMRGRPN